MTTFLQRCCQQQKCSKAFLDLTRRPSTTDCGTLSLVFVECRLTLRVESRTDFRNGETVLLK